MRRLEQSNALSQGAKAEALQKIQRLNVEIGFPESSRHAFDGALRKDDLIGSLTDLSEAAYREQIDRLKRPADARRWWMSPLSVNASYSQTANTLIIPAGRLQPPLFDARADDEANFGGVGTLIGHEMGHAIDNQGRQYDRFGQMRQWWTAEDRRSFEQRTNRLVRQYSDYEALPGERVNGAATLSENIADLVGLTIAYEALLLRKGGTLSEAQQREFLRSWARRWRAKYSPELLLRVTRSDTHPPNQFRCSGPLKNFGPFYDVMNLTRPENLLAIW
jgi:predicted metalloendopeptidase